jgi:K+-transporting ATPase ATPase B chain
MARKRYPGIAAFEPELIRGALIGAVLKLDPRSLVRNPVMFLVEIGGIITTLITLAGLASPAAGDVFFSGMVSLWLWLTVLFANVAESLSEGRGKARAASLRESRAAVPAHRLREEAFGAQADEVASSDLRQGDLVLVREGEIVPGDGEVVKGAALVNEAAITGESAPVVREAGGDRSAVTGEPR